jgi:hypothetical protein
VIPILGDAQAEASGRIIRFEVPNKRTAYDADLRSFRSQLSASLQQMQEAAIAHPGPKTDILGSLALAEQELDAQPTSSQILIVLSDFLQDDGEIDFEKDKELEVSPIAQRFANRLSSVNPINLHNTKIYLGLIESADFGRLTKQRRIAILAFWRTYLKTATTQPAEFVVDGIGLLRSFSGL